MLDFNNTEIAFSAKSQSELKNAYLLFNTIKYPWLVKCASVVSNIALNIHFPLGWAVKPTLYKQFVGGETLQDCTKAIDHLRKFNVRSTLDFSAEGSKRPKEYKLLLRKPYVRLILQREMIIWPMPYSNRPPS